jgi:Domain of unknown function (DUF3854)
MATIKAAGIRPVPPDRLPEYARNATSSYIIPYFDLKGQPIKGFYRTRWLPAVRLNGREVRYNQPPESGTHLYLPPPPIVDPKRWTEHDQHGNYEPLWLTEGEKKALKAAQEGFLCAGLGGIYSWRRNSAKVPKDKVKESKDGKYLIVPVDKETGADTEGKALSDTAPELTEIPLAHRVVYIVYDADPTLNSNVDIAAFELAMWLYEKGAEPYRVVLPGGGYNGHKVGLDDFLKAHGASELRRLAHDPERTKFPKHPLTDRWIQKQLNSQNKRPTVIKVARAVIAGLDYDGDRYVDENNTYYYFDRRVHEMHDFGLSTTDVRQLRNTTFGRVLINEYGVLSSDSSALSAIADSFAKWEPIRQIKPRTIIHATRLQNGQDVLYFQVSDSRIARVSADSITFVNNGHEGVLFRSGMTAPVDEEAIQDYLATHGRPQNLWLKALQEFNVKAFPGGFLDKRQSVLLLAALFHLSPWLKRWRGMMLPFELAIAEPNSGKTVLYNLRRGILTGSRSLDNTPTDMRSWYAQLAQAPAMWVCDNLGDIKRDMREPMSDELARLITDDDPHADTRELFTTSDIARIKLDCTFAATAIRNPFWKPDILQRSLIFNMSAIPAGDRDSDWCGEHLERRADWVGEHLLSIQRFFYLVRQGWVSHYRSGNRLSQFEQGVKVMLKALGHGADAEYIGSHVQDVIQTSIADHDPTMDALRTFASEWFEASGRPTAALSDVVDWAQEDMEGRFVRLKTVKSANALSRYFTAHEYDIQHSAGLKTTWIGKHMHILPAVPPATINPNGLAIPPSTETETKA